MAVMGRACLRPPGPGTGDQRLAYTTSSPCCWAASYRPRPCAATLALQCVACWEEALLNVGTKYAAGVLGLRARGNCIEGLRIRLCHRVSSPPSVENFVRRRRRSGEPALLVASLVRRLLSFKQRGEVPCPPPPSPLPRLVLFVPFSGRPVPGRTATQAGSLRVGGCGLAGCIAPVV